MAIKYTDKGAALSPCGRYRYRLWRDWTAGWAAPRVLAVTGLNPSTADANVDDPTIRRLVGLAVRLDCNRLEMTNLFAYRATEPRELERFIRSGGDPFGHVAAGPNDSWTSLADRYVCDHCAGDDVVYWLAAWGASNLVPKYLAREFAAEDESHAWRAFERGNIYALKLNASGSPAHPLYVPNDLRPRLVRELRAELET